MNISTNYILMDALEKVVSILVLIETREYITRYIQDIYIYTRYIQYIKENP